MEYTLFTLLSIMAKMTEMQMFWSALAMPAVFTDGVDIEAEFAEQFANHGFCVRTDGIHHEPYIGLADR